MKLNERLNALIDCANALKLELVFHDYGRVSVFDKETKMEYDLVDLDGENPDCFPPIFEYKLRKEI